LSLFPLLLAAVSMAAYFVEPTWAIDQATRLMGGFLPGGETQIAEIIRAVFEAGDPAASFRSPCCCGAVRASLAP